MAQNQSFALSQWLMGILHGYSSSDLCCVAAQTQLRSAER